MRQAATLLLPALACCGHPLSERECNYAASGVCMNDPRSVIESTVLTLSVGLMADSWGSFRPHINRWEGTGMALYVVVLPLAEAQVLCGADACYLNGVNEIYIGTWPDGHLMSDRSRNYWYGWILTHEMLHFLIEHQGWSQDHDKKAWTKLEQVQARLWDAIAEWY